VRRARPLFTCFRRLWITMMVITGDNEDDNENADYDESTMMTMY